MTRISRRKWQEAVRCLKTAIKPETKLPWTQKIRCIELLMAIYQVPLPETSRNPKRSVKELIEERAGERTINEQIRQAVQERVREEAEREEQDKVSKALQDFLKGGEHAKNE
jgi:hypothetical protein